MRAAAAGPAAAPGAAARSDQTIVCVGRVAGLRSGGLPHCTLNTGITEIQIKSTSMPEHFPTIHSHFQIHISSRTVSSVIRTPLTPCFMYPTISNIYAYGTFAVSAQRTIKSVGLRSLVCARARALNTLLPYICAYCAIFLY